MLKSPFYDVDIRLSQLLIANRIVLELRSRRTERKKGKTNIRVN